MSSALNPKVSPAKSPTTAGAWILRLGVEAILPAGFTLGHSQDELAGTGCSAVLCKTGATGGVSVRGAAPATRETDLLDPKKSVNTIHAVVLSGGSAFGLEAATGVMHWLAERNIGFVADNDNCVPIVCGASLYDLAVGDNKAYPDANAGRAACENAGTKISVGSVGAGTGASAGKMLGNEYAMKSGFGAASTQLGDLIVTSLVAVNPLGTVYDRQTGTLLAGGRNPRDLGSILDPYESFLFLMTELQQNPEADTPSTNTTIGCILTNGAVTKAQAAHIADMAHDGYARAIEPVHTSFDGDAIFVLSTATLPTSPDLLGALGAFTMEAAIHNAVLSASSAFGLPAARDLSA